VVAEYACGRVQDSPAPMFPYLAEETRVRFDD
jgi:hypothetical protein